MNARTGALGAALVLAVAAVYGQTLGFGFVALDVPRYVTANEVVQQGLGTDGLVWAFTSTHDGNWFPLTWLSHMLDVELFGLAAGGHHATNVLLHAVNTLLLLGGFLCLTGAFWPSAFVAACFALHPLHVESVAWVAERKDLLSTAFGLATLWCYARYARCRAGDGARWLAACALCLAAGLMAKPMLVTLPFVLLLLDWWPLGRLGGPRGVPLRRLWLEKLPLFALSLISCAITFQVQSAGGGTLAGAGLPLSLRLVNALLALGQYLRQAFWPVDLMAFYPHPFLAAAGVVEPVLPALTASALALLAITALSLVFWRRRYLFVGWAWFLGMLVPVIGVVQVGAQGAADRYTYLPLVGLAVMLAWGVKDLVAERVLPRAVVWLAAPALAMLALAAHAQVGTWRSSESLYRHALAIDAGNHFMRFALALRLREEGRAPEAVEQYERLLKANPDSGRAHNGLGRVRLREGQYRAAEARFARAAELTPEVTLVHFNLGRALEAQGRDEEALAAYRRVLELRPRSARAHVALGDLYLARGERASAARHYEQALERKPDHAQAQRGLARARK
jgi:tetratricopeptide (TPR) repeat protein